jgi:hypothetical protein
MKICNVGEPVDENVMFGDDNNEIELEFMIKVLLELIQEDGFI